MLECLVVSVVSSLLLELLHSLSVTQPSALSRETLSRYTSGVTLILYCEL